MTETGARYVYCCRLTLCEHTFFSSRELGAFFQTEALIGNYALAYAMGLAHAPYHATGGVGYARELRPAHERGIYVTPATLVPPVRFALAEWNALSDAYWYAFSNNTIVVRPEGGRAFMDGQTWYRQRPGERRQKLGPANFPQHGRVKMLAHGNRAVCYVLSPEALALPPYIRLGKWMSKARLEVEGARVTPVERPAAPIPVLLNPADLADPDTLFAFDLISVHPVPLVQNAVIGGPCLHAPDGVWLPAGMRFAPAVLP